MELLLKNTGGNRCLQVILNLWVFWYFLTVRIQKNWKTGNLKDDQIQIEKIHMFQISMI